ncbi:MAG: hypothetical protein PWP75_1049 [Caldanaerobacter sp.]|nr:hypothetical protein [Caldanaerobacter sp.]
MKKLTYKIVKKGRKWFEGKTEKGYKAKIEINEVSKNWEVDKTYTFGGRIEVEEFRGHKKWKVYPVCTAEELQKEAEKERQAERKKRELEVSIRLAKEWLGYIEQHLTQEEWYYKGEQVVKEKIETIKKIGTKKAEEMAEEIKIKLDTLKEKYEEEQKLFVLTRGSGYIEGELEGPFSVGEVVKAPERLRKLGAPEYLYVVKTKEEYIPENGYSFGVGAESGYLYIAKCREAVPEEYTHLVEKEKKEQEKAKANREINEIKKKIREEGERPECEHILKGEILFNAMNIDGTGDCFIIDEKYIWYVMNHGADGDDWNVNNVSGITSGAGGIGWRIPYNPEVVKQLRKIEEVAKND